MPKKSGNNKRISIKQKNLTSIAVLMLAIIVILSTLATINLNRAYEHVVETAEQGFDDNIRIAVETVISALEVNYEQVQNGLISDETARELAANIVRDTRYSSGPGKDNDGYFWADMADGYCVVHYNPANEGKMRWDWEDKEGTFFIRNFIALGDAGGGFSDFYFGKPGDEEGSHKKRGYTAKFEPYGWYISTGNYYEDTDEIIKLAEEQKRNSLILLLGASVIIAVIGFIFLSRRLDRIVIPIKNISEQIRSLTLGDTEVSIFTTNEGDEVSELEEGIHKLANAINNQAEIMKSISNGDYSVSIEVRSEKDVMNQSIMHMLEITNNTLRQIKNSTDQVAAGSKRIADGSRALAKGSDEQAAAVGHLSESISQISNKTIANAEMASRAASLASMIKADAEKGSRQMDEMISAVNEISEASQNIGKVINLIDEIAFQTSILALNAAVEAARAGSHGKGFAVVAEEVRSLAGRSAEAARNTGDLIANSMEKAQLGTDIANETASSLAKIVAGINESNQIADDIAKSSGEQSDGIKHINDGIEQVNYVIQQNSQTAKEGATASERMYAQSSKLEEITAQFKLKRAERTDDNKGAYDG